VNFDAQSDLLAGLLGSRTQEQIYTSQLGNATGPTLMNSLNAGRALVNYYGHGSYQFWSQTNSLNFNTASVTTLTNTGKEAFITSMNCQSGDYDWAQGTPLLNALVLKPQGGAIGAIGASAASLTGDQAEFNQAVYASLLSGARVGDALKAGYAAIHDPDVRVQFVLIGDPALRVDLGN
jgi:hypothetical protein